MKGWLCAMKGYLSHKRLGFGNSSCHKMQMYAIEGKWTSMKGKGAAMKGKCPIDKP